MRRVRTQPMTCTERQLREALDKMLEVARERPFATIAGKIAVPMVRLDD